MKAEPEVVSPTGSMALDELPPRQSSFKAHAARAAFIAFAIAVLFWRVFLFGETLIDVNTLNNQLPWGYSAGQSDYPYNRRDLTDTYVTRDYFVVQSYRDGEMPLWNPYTMAGHPIYADGVTRTLSPFLLFYKFFDVPLGYSLARITELILAAILMYLFLVSIGVTANGSLMGSLVFGLSAHSMFHLTGLGWWGGLMWLPAILLFTDRAIKRQSFTQAALAGVCLALQFFCGYLPNQIYYVGAVVLYYGFFAYAARRDEKSNRVWPRTLTLMVVTICVGLVLAATQWVPSLELLSYSNRKIVGAELSYIYLPPWYSLTLVFPNLFGAAYDAKMLTLFTALGVSHDHILYLGIAALAPIGFCLYWLKLTRGRKRDGVTLRGGDAARRERVVFFALLVTVALVTMMAAPLYVPITRYIPILQVIRVAVRAGVLFLFAASTLVAFGSDLLLESKSDLLERFFMIARRFAVAATGFVVVALFCVFTAKLTGFAAEEVGRGRIAFIRRSAAALSFQFTPPNLSILIPLALVFVTLFLIHAFSKQRLLSRSFLFGLVGLLVIDLAWNSNQFDHTFNRSNVFPRTEITDLLRSLPPGRVLVYPSDLDTNRTVAGAGQEKIIAPPNTLLPYQIPTVSGKNQQFPKWYREFASLIEPQPNLSHVVFDKYQSPFFDVLNVKYVVTHESAVLGSQYELLRNAEGVCLYENKRAMPRAFFAKNLIQVNSADQSLDAMRSQGFDPGSQTVVEVDSKTIALPKATNDDPRTVASAGITASSRNWVWVETENIRDGLLVLSDNYYPGWTAMVDGEPSRILRANHTMRAVEVPSGHHMVTFLFMPASFFQSFFISSVAALVIALALVLPLILAAVKRKRSVSAQALR
jgi:hypothetical protein